MSLNFEKCVKPRTFQHPLVLRTLIKESHRFCQGQLVYFFAQKVQAGRS